MRNRIILASVAALATLTCVPAAMAAKTKTTVRMTSAFLGNGQSFWDGTIKSSKKACANKRSVTVYTGAGKKIGTVKSQRVTGVVGYHWTLAAQIAIKPGKRYYAKPRRLARAAEPSRTSTPSRASPSSFRRLPRPPRSTPGRRRQRVRGVRRTLIAIAFGSSV
jgi:hypothetical protein